MKNIFFKFIYLKCNPVSVLFNTQFDNIILLQNVLDFKFKIQNI